MPRPFSLRSGFMSTFELSREDQVRLHDHVRTKAQALIDASAFMVQEPVEQQQQQAQAEERRNIELGLEIDLGLPLLDTTDSTSIGAAAKDEEEWKPIKMKPNFQLWEQQPQPQPSSSHSSSSNSSTTQLEESSNGSLDILNHHHNDSYTVKSSTVIDADIETILKVLQSGHKTESTRTLYRLLYETTFADAAVLYTKNLLAPMSMDSSQPHYGNESQEHLAVKWLAFRNRFPLVSDQDVCVAELTQRYGLDDARRGHVNNQWEDLDNDREQRPAEQPQPIAVHVQTSIPSRHCPSLSHTHKLERAHWPLSGYVFFPTSEATQTRVVYLLSMAQPPQHPLRRRSNRTLAQQLATASVLRLKHTIDVIEISSSLQCVKEQERDPQSHWISDQSRRACAICIRSFTTMRRRHHCRLCGDVMCSRCSRYKDAKLPHVSLSSVRICIDCDQSLGKATTSSSSSRHRPFSSSNKSMTLTTTTQPPTGKSFLRTQHQTSTTKDHRMLLDSKKGSFSSQEDPKVILKLLCELASDALDCAYAAVSLVESDEHYLKAAQYDRLLSAPTNLQCCAPIMAAAKSVYCPDLAQNPQYRNLPIVKGPHQARMYAGAPLMTRGDRPVIFGAVCVFDAKVGKKGPPSKEQLVVMENLARLAALSLASSSSNSASSSKEIDDDALVKQPARGAHHHQFQKLSVSTLPAHHHQTSAERLSQMLCRVRQTENQLRLNRKEMQRSRSSGMQSPLGTQQ